MPRPSGKPSESKQALVVALVFMILLSLGLALTAYYGFAEQAELIKAKKEADILAATNKKLRDIEKLQRLVLMAYVGESIREEDKQALSSLYQSYLKGEFDRELESAKVKDDVKAMFERLKKDLGWDDLKAQPEKTYKLKVTTLVAELDQLSKERGEFGDATKKGKDDLQGLIRTNDEKIKQLQQELKKAQDALANQKDDKSKEFMDAVAEIEKLRDDAKKMGEAHEQALVAKDEELAKLRKEFTDLKAKYDKEKATEAVLKVSDIKLSEHDTPKGKVLRTDPTGKFAYIDIGSAQNIKPQATFAIFGVGPGGQPEQERKGSLEVVSVLDPKMSMCRITDLRDPLRFPVLKGDLLFNPAWSPNNKEHIAIAGIIDLTGDGSDNTVEFIRLMEKQGIVVDEYLDLKDLTFKGKGMSLKTKFLVAGFVPEPKGNIVEGNKIQELQIKVLERASEMKDRAAKLGIEMMPARRFMAMIGMKLPKQVREPEYAIQGLGNVNGGEGGMKEGGEMERER